jgi:uncharacterized protein with FMN-binding domain
MKKIILSTVVIFAFVAYAVHQQLDHDDDAKVVPVRTGAPQKSSQQSTTQGSPTLSQFDLYKNGSYTGDVTDAYYGNLQVRAVIQNGKIADVQFLVYPNDRETSRQINEQAMPSLKQEAIQAQNANVDIVSGATQTSEAFVKSLQSALAQAKG